MRSASPLPDTDLSGQRRVVDALLAAARDGGFDTLIEVLDQDMLLSRFGPSSTRRMAGRRSRWRPTRG
jgi:RNA polymerase sigma-70 factor (ECF subfamily)